jgi:hypothetical protein
MNMEDRSPLPAFQVHAVDVNDSTHLVKAVTGTQGRYELDITEERTYRITYTATGHLSKCIQVAVAGPSPEQWMGGYGMNVDIVLPKADSAEDPEWYREPWGIASFNVDSARYEWDLEYTRAFREKMAREKK